MTRLVGYILGALSGFAAIGSLVTLIYQLVVILETDKDTNYGPVLSWIVLELLILALSFIIFYYVYQTGFGQTKLEKAREELELIKINQELQKIKSSE